EITTPFLLISIKAQRSSPSRLSGCAVLRSAWTARTAIENGEFAVRRAFLVTLWCLISAMPARAEVRILASPGGEVGTYLELFSVLRQSGQRVVIDGPCFSACTLVLSTIARNGRGHPKGRAGLPPAPLDRPGGSAICRHCGDTPRSRHLSRHGTCLD